MGYGGNRRGHRSFPGIDARLGDVGGNGFIHGHNGSPRRFGHLRERRAQGGKPFGPDGIQVAGVHGDGVGITDAALLVPDIEEVFSVILEDSEGVAVHRQPVPGVFRGRGIETGEAVFRGFGTLLKLHGHHGLGGVRIGDDGAVRLSGGQDARLVGGQGKGGGGGGGERQIALTLLDQGQGPAVADIGDRGRPTILGGEG